VTLELSLAIEDSLTRYGSSWYEPRRIIPSLVDVVTKLPQYDVEKEKLQKVYRPEQARYYGSDTSYDYGYAAYSPIQFGDLSGLLTALSTGECAAAKEAPESWIRLINALKRAGEQIRRKQP
jgi:hypothetical protein